MNDNLYVRLWNPFALACDSCKEEHGQQVVMEARPAGRYLSLCGPCAKNVCRIVEMLAIGEEIKSPAPATEKS